MFLPRLKECEGCKRMTTGVRKGENCSHLICPSCEQVPFECYEHTACLKCYQELPYCQICSILCSSCNNSTYIFATCNNGHKTCPECSKVLLNCGKHTICKLCYKTNAECSLCWENCFKCNRIVYTFQKLPCGIHRVCVDCFEDPECTVCINQCYKCKNFGYGMEKYKNCNHYYCSQKCMDNRGEKCNLCSTCNFCNKVNNINLSNACADCIDQMTSIPCSSCGKLNKNLLKVCGNHRYCEQCLVLYNKNCPFCNYRDLISGMCQVCKKIVPILRILGCKIHKSCELCYANNSGKCILSWCVLCNDHKLNLIKSKCNHSFCDDCFNNKTNKKCNFCCETCKKINKEDNKYCKLCEEYFCKKCWGLSGEMCKNCFLKCNVCKNPGLNLCDVKNHILCEKHCLGFTDKCGFCCEKLKKGNCVKCSTQTTLIKCSRKHLSCENCYDIKKNICMTCTAEDLCQSCKNKAYEKSFNHNKGVVKFCNECFLLKVCSYCSKNFSTSKLCQKHIICEICLKNMNICSLCDKNSSDSVKLEKKIDLIEIKKKDIPIVKEKHQVDVEEKLWNCNCGTSNMKDFEVCQKCHKIKPGVKGWVCGACKTLNEEYKHRCSICGSTRDLNIKAVQEYWICEKCKSAIVINADFCDKCKTLKNATPTVKKAITEKKIFQKNFKNIELIDSLNSYDNKPLKEYKSTEILEELKYVDSLDKFPQSSKKKSHRKEWICKDCNALNKYDASSCSNCNNLKI